MTFKTPIKNFFATWFSKSGNSEVLAELERLRQQNIDLRRRNNELSRQLALPAQRIELEVSRSPEAAFTITLSDWALMGCQVSSRACKRQRIKGCLFPRRNRRP